MQFTRLKALIIKEFHQIVRDPSSILISFILPAILLFIYGYGISLDYKHLKIGLVLEDTAPDVQSFAKALSDSPYFSVEISRERSEFERQLTCGSIRGIVIVPSYFSAFKERKDQTAPIQVIADGSEPNTAHFVQNYVQGAFHNWLKQEAKTVSEVPHIALEPRYWFNEELKSRNFLIPGSIALIMTLIGTLLTSLVVAREWERGTMEAIMATPVKTCLRQTHLLFLSRYGIFYLFHLHCFFSLWRAFKGLIFTSNFFHYYFLIHRFRNGTPHFYSL